MPDARAPRNGSRAWTPSAARHIHLRDLHLSNNNRRRTGGSAALGVQAREPFRGSRASGVVFSLLLGATLRRA